MPDHADPALDDLLCFAVYSANLAFSRVYRPLLEELGLTYVQYLVMSVLWRGDDLVVGDLGARLFLTSSTLTPVLKRLETMDLVARTRDGDDERRVRIRTTAKGRALRARADEVPNCILQASGLEPTEAARLLDAIAKLRDRLLAAVAPEAEPV